MRGTHRITFPRSQRNVLDKFFKFRDSRNSNKILLQLCSITEISLSSERLAYCILIFSDSRKIRRSYFSEFRENFPTILSDFEEHYQIIFSRIGENCYEFWVNLDSLEMQSKLFINFLGICRKILNISLCVRSKTIHVRVKDDKFSVGRRFKIEQIFA